MSAAGFAPSGAHMQPWHFVVVRYAATKQQIRQA
ncbi:MAG: nitroreductase family protein, partial [Cellvibrionales bacterium]